MSNRFLLLFIRAEGTPGPVRQQTYAAEESLDVRDLATRVNVRIRAQEVSPYRHTLFVDGRAYQIMNVIRQY